MIRSHDTKKTPCWMANDAKGQQKQRDNLIQKAHILSFQGPTAPFAIQQGDFCIMWPSRAKGTAKCPFQRSHSICTPRFWREKVSQTAGFFCQEIVCPPAFFIKKTEHIQVSYKVLRINKGKKIIATLILFVDFKGESQVCLWQSR